MSLKHDLQLSREWYRAHRDFGLWPDWREYLRIRKAYAEPHRFYHTWRHISETIRYTRLHYGFQPLVILALFYHDIVYDVARQDNEDVSADEWIRYAKTRHLHRRCLLKVNMIADMIRMTKSHTVEPNKPLQFSIMNDADMSIFLCPDKHYLEYARNIWLEYQSFGVDQYIKGRLSFLRSCNPSKLFYTHQARAHIRHAIANLDLERTILEQNPEVLLATG